MRAIAIEIPSTPYDLTAQIARLRELGAPEEILPTETNRQKIAEERLTPLLGFYKNCGWEALTQTQKESVTRYIHFQYQPKIVFRELERLQESQIIRSYAIGCWDRQAGFSQAEERQQQGRKER